MRNLLCILGLLIVSLSNAKNSGGEILNHELNYESENIECKTLGILADELLKCNYSTTTTINTSIDGTTTITRTTTVSCDTPQELAEFHKIMKESGINI